MSEGGLSVILRSDDYESVHFGLALAAAALAVNKQAVLFFEPRVEVLQVEAHISSEDWGCLQVLLDYRIRSTNTRHNLVYPLYLDQASNPVSAG